ncbi:MAG: diguanylate cyclase domain-containing protein, partial [Janthinobacterium lividum]
MLVLGLIGFLAVSAAIIVSAARVADNSTDKLAMNQIDSNMRVGWHLMHELGRSAHIVDGRLLVGTTVLNGNQILVNELQNTVGGVATVFEGDERIATTVRDAAGKLGIGTHLAAGPARTAVLDEHRPFRGVVDVLGSQYFSGYDPIVNENGVPIGVLYVGIRKTDLLGAVILSRLVSVAVSAGCILLIAILFLIVGRHLAQQIILREQSLQDTNQHLAIALENMAMGLCRWSADGTLLVVNRRLAEILDLPLDALQIGMSFRDFLLLCFATGNYGSRTFETVHADCVVMIGLQKPMSILDCSANGRVVALAHRPVEDGGWLTTYEDVTEHKQAEAQLAFMARHDSLTELPNRVLFNERLNQALARDVGAAILCLDLDRFKEVNDTLGHPAGDGLLKETAARLLRCVRAGDTVARLGGDEFAIVLSPLSRPEDALATAERILDLVGQPFDIGGEQIVIGVSVGIDVSSPDSKDPDTILKQADLAL